MRPKMKEVPATPPLATLLAQQREHWQLGERIPVETYLLRHPSLTDDADVVLDLIGNELLLRLELGERPLLAEFVQRFPQWSAELTIQFQVEMAVEAEARRTEQRPPPATPQQVGSPTQTSENETLIPSS